MRQPDDRPGERVPVWVRTILLLWVSFLMWGLWQAVKMVGRAFSGY